MAAKMDATIKVASATRSRLQREQLRVSGAIGVRLTMDDMLNTLVDLAGRHPDEVVGLQTEAQGTEG